MKSISADQTSPLKWPDDASLLLSMEPWAAAEKLSVSVAVPPAPVRVPSQSPLVPSVKSVTLVANDMGDNEMIPEAVHRSPGICLTDRKSVV